MAKDFEQEIATALHNAKANGYQELRIDVKTQKITPIRRGPGVRIEERRHVVITRIART